MYQISLYTAVTGQVAIPLKNIVLWEEKKGENMALIYAIDQGTSSSRVLVFQTSDWKVISQHQLEFNSIYPDEGWCEQDPLVILQTVKDVSQKSI